MKIARRCLNKFRLDIKSSIHNAKEREIDVVWKKYRELSAAKSGINNSPYIHLVFKSI